MAVADGRPLGFGDPAPFFTARTDGDLAYSIQVAAGRWLVLMAFGSLGGDLSRQAHDEAMKHRALFDDAEAAFFGVSIDPADPAHRGLANATVGVRYLWDFDLAASRQLGLMQGDSFVPTVFLIDPAFRIAMAKSIGDTPLVLERLAQELANCPAPADAPHAPVLILPRIFEPEVCQELIRYFQAREPVVSGFAADVDGRTMERVDFALKRRHDVTIDDEGLRAQIEHRVNTRLAPMIQRAFGWRATRIERFLICRYASQDRGFFSAHRDDVTAGAAHRKFAVTLNLNDDFEGGALRFPEFGRRTYRPQAGGAAVFCCSLLHEATPVTDGVRYAFLPFLYDEAGARLRKANLSLVGQPQGNRHDRRAAKSRR